MTRPRAFFSDPLVPGQYEQDRHLLTQLQYQDNFADNTLMFQDGCSWARNVIPRYSTISTHPFFPPVPAIGKVPNCACCPPPGPITS